MTLCSAAYGLLLFLVLGMLVVGNAIIFAHLMLDMALCSIFGIILVLQNSSEVGVDWCSVYR